MLKPGSRWKSQVCSAEAVLVRPPKIDGVPQCGGVDMVPMDGEVAAATALAGLDTGCLVGKRYRSDELAMEMLCTKAGTGALGFAGTALELVEAKKLPSSD
ncbi:hypothetical protein OLX02_17855 [Novosphingobium sp. KCTC 2891]|uniref:hypothetical protein n=1 Tax=Novosphingobium sp. KCTC 2891 TaxID=2989730 RepID=UPI002222F427|nr:hypothetical protein [Novosphingobium sp. KCTC 2891]MCW1384686.1 hypothetical protein [Novosphingobium sp. KCTC 2891]